ncbi:MAG: hypothetical protein CMJ58_14485 [Planctomycetaceae bacterium]|nr:hypothetical protein [Planctomycetaceae bacterium]
MFLQQLAKAGDLSQRRLQVVLGLPTAEGVRLADPLSKGRREMPTTRRVVCDIAQPSAPARAAFVD